jgi:intracellular sulfur oxidation DsrE/DsrF family protein
MKTSLLLRLIVLILGVCASALSLAGGTVVYHINDASNARVLLGNVQNHLNAAPDTNIHVVSNGSGIDFLLKNATDDGGKPFAPAVQALAHRGVAFKVCRNSLKGRGLGEDSVLPDASIVAAGVVEIARLQLDEKAAYIKP